MNSDEKADLSEPTTGSDDGSQQRLPSLPRQLWNVSVAVAEFVADGLRTVSVETYRRRLEICGECPARRGKRCGACGCYLPWKARGRVFRCPLGKWE